MPEALVRFLCRISPCLNHYMSFCDNSISSIGLIITEKVFFDFTKYMEKNYEQFQAL